MIVKVLLFAHLQDIVGSELALNLPTGTRVAEALAALGNVDGRFARLMPSTRTAVNGDWADEAVVLNDGDELALIPPVSGG